MTISEEARQLIEEEERILAKVLESLRAQQTKGEGRLLVEAKKARSLTSAMVATRRDEDKQLIASDEAVAHGLTAMKKKELEGLEKLLDKPYFARIVFEEFSDSGVPKTVEYKLGTTTNIDCRIIDWRKAPISKLFYEYREGDEFSETIQQRDRDGKILIRHKLEIEGGELKRVSCRYGDFVKQDNGWIPAAGSARAGRTKGYSRMPDVLSLITPEQFRAITEERDHAILIQGVAGSGKTTVAMHRLSWLLHEGLELPSEVAVVVRSEVLKRYIEESLPELDLAEVKVFRFDHWLKDHLKLVPGFSDFEVLDTEEDLSAIRVKQSFGFIELLERRFIELVEREPSFYPSVEQLLKVALDTLGRSSELVAADETKLLEVGACQEAARQLEARLEARQLLESDLTVVFRLYQVYEERFEPDNLKRYKHLVIDEVQDYGVLELSVVLGAVSKPHQVTLVGDEAQAIHAGSSFPGWEKLRKLPRLKDAFSKFLSLRISHRSTAPIMRLASYVRGDHQPIEGRAGKAPIWFKCLVEDTAMRETINWLNRVQEKFPGTLIAVLTRSRQEAKHLSSLLHPSFGYALRFSTESDISFEEGIIVCEIGLVKGLEFPQVLLWNISDVRYPVSEMSKNLLYIGMTRAEDHLCLITWGKHSPLLPGSNSKLIRLVEEEPPAEEEDDGGLFGVRGE